jgi:hypothetical protein
MAGQDLTSISVPASLSANSGGLNSTSSALALKQNESSDLQNIDFNRFGSFLKRGGYTQLNTVAFNGGATFVGLHWLQLSSGSNFLIGVAGNSIAKMDSLDGTWDVIDEDQSVVFTGAGLDDATSSGTYTGTGDIEYKVVIDATGAPDTFEWFKDGVSQAAGVGITGAAQLLDNGLSITFAATTGHTVTDQWVFHPAVTITASNDNLISSITFRDTYLATNGVDLPFQWDGTGNVKLMTTPIGLTTAKFVETFQNYTILANTVVSGGVFKSRVHWSTINTIDTWSSTDLNDVNRDDGSEITGLKTLGEELIIFKEFAIHKATFTGDRDIPFLFNKTRSRVGAVSGYSIQEVENGLVFRSKDGWYFFDGNNSFKISDRINVTVDGFNDNRAQFTTSVYQQTKNRYWASSSAGAASTHDTVVTWTFAPEFINAFSIYKGMNPSVFAIVTTSGEERVYFGDYSGFVYRADTSSRNDEPSGTDTAIDAFYKTRWEAYGNILNQKGVPEVAIYYQSTSATLTLSYSYDFEDADQFTQTFSLSPGGALYGSAIYGTDVYGSSGGAVKRRDLTGRGRVIRLHFANSTLDETFQIDGIGALPYLETQV